MANASKAISSGALGASLSIGGVTGGTDTFVAIGELNDITPSGRKLDVIKVSQFGSTTYGKIGTILDAGQLTCKLNFVPSDAGQLAVLAAANARVPYDFQLQMPPNAKAGQTTKGNLYAFSALVSDYSGPAIATTKADELSFTLDIDGDWTVTPGS